MGSLGREYLIYNFEERLNFSQGERGQRDVEILKHAIRNCVDVIKTDVEQDKKGIDYIATLEGGAKIGIDVKARDKGVSKYWKDGEEDLLLERRRRRFVIRNMECLP